MTYDELDVITDVAWLAFFNVFKDNGLDIYKIEQAMDNKDCFNDVEDAIMTALHNEIEGGMMSNVLKKEIVVTMTVRDALRAYAVLGVTNGATDSLYYTLEAHLRSFGDTDEAERISRDKLKKGSYWDIQHELEQAFLRVYKTETELKIDKLEENVKQLQSQIQALRTTVEEKER